MNAHLCRGGWGHLVQCYIGNCAVANAISDKLWSSYWNVQFQRFADALCIAAHCLLRTDQEREALVNGVADLCHTQGVDDAD